MEMVNLSQNVLLDVRETHQNGSKNPAARLETGESPTVPAKKKLRSRKMITWNQGVGTVEDPVPRLPNTKREEVWLDPKTIP